MELSSMLQNIEPQLARALYDKASRYAEKIDLTLGDPDFDTPDFIREAGCKAIRDGKTKYTANAGILPLREAISDDVYRRLGVRYDPNTEIICTIGAMGSLYLASAAILSPGDEMIILAPHWPNYTNMVGMSHAIPIYVDTYNVKSWDEVLSDLDGKVTGKTKALILNSPCNPTGKMYTKEQLKTLADFAKEHDLWVFADEVYHTITFDGRKHESITRFPGMKERTVLIDSLSKRFSMTGWRSGFCCAPKELVYWMTQLNEDVAACVPQFVQVASIEGLRNGREAERKIRDGFYERTREMTKRLNEIPMIHCPNPDGTFYLFVDIRETGLSSEEFAYALLEKEQVAVVPGNAFNKQGEGYIRIACTLAVPKLLQACDKIEKFVRENCMK